MLASGGDTLPDPGSVMAAMLGDLTTWVRVPATPGIRVEVTLGFGEHGKMVDQQGKPRNTRISAIGLLSPICPDDVYSGYADQVRELAVEHLSDDGSEEAAHRYLAACTDLKTQLMAAGYELDTFATQVEYVVNPVAAKPFPTADLAQGYVKVWEYDLATQRFGMTYDWGKLSKPR